MIRHKVRTEGRNPWRRLMGWLSSSLRIRFQLGLLFMLLPLVVLGASHFLVSLQVQRVVETLAQLEVEGLHEVLEAQRQLLEAAMPPNDYLIHGNIEERQEYAQQARGVSRTLQNLLSSRLPALQKQRPTIQRAWREWQAAQPLAQRILALENPRLEAGGAQLMEELDLRLDLASRLLEKAHEVIHEEADSQRAWLLQIRGLESVVGIVVFFLSLIAASVAGYLLSRSVLMPIRTLEAAVQRFAQGDHSFRVALKSDDELGTLASLLNQMAARIQTDPLTGLLTRGEFIRRMEGELSRCLRYGRCFTLLLLDLDHFKQVNDRHGHLAGDAVLREIGGRLARACRAADLVARYGGEELAAILPETERDEAWEVAERLRLWVGQRPVSVGAGLDIQVTVSVGMATYPADASTVAQLLARADEALYAAKAGGRNQVARPSGENLENPEKRTKDATPS